MKNHKTGYYCYRAGEKFWHRTLEGALNRAREAQFRGFSYISIVCCGCGGDEDDCTCRGGPEDYYRELEDNFI